MANPSENKNIEFSYDRVSIMRRISAALFDFFVSFICGFILLFLTIFILSKVPSLQDASALRVEIATMSGLYGTYDGTYQRYVEYVDSLDLSYDEKSALLDECLNKFFSNEDFVIDGSDIYLEIKTLSTDEDGNFIFTSEGDRIFVNDDYDEEYYYFYVSVFQTALNYLSGNKVYSAETSFLYISYISGIVITFLVPIGFFYIVIPLFFKRNRQTFGMKIVKIALVNVDGLSLKIGKYLGRACFFFIVEVILSLAAFLVPLLLSIGMLVLMKSHQTLHDYVFNTYCVNLDRGKIFFDYQEYQDSLEDKETISLEDESYKPSLKK